MISGLLHFVLAILQTFGICIIMQFLMFVQVIRKKPLTYKYVKGFFYDTYIIQAADENRTRDLRTTNATHYRLCYNSTKCIIAMR